MADEIAVPGDLGLKVIFNLLMASDAFLVVTLNRAKDGEEGEYTYQFRVCGDLLVEDDRIKGEVLQELVENLGEHLKEQYGEG